MSLTNILPPINNIYYTAVKIPFAGAVNIMYERLEETKVGVKLTGAINVHGNIYYDINNDYKIDDCIKTVLDEYKCSFLEPDYDSVLDIIDVKIRFNLFKYTKRLTLRNIDDDQILN